MYHINTDLTFDVMIETDIDKVSAWSYGILVDEEAAAGLRVNITTVRNFTYGNEWFSNDCLIYTSDDLDTPAAYGPCYYIAKNCLYCDSSVEEDQSFVILDPSVDCPITCCMNYKWLSISDAHKLISECDTEDIADGVGFVQGVVTTTDINTEHTFDVADSPLLTARMTVHVEGTASEGQKIKLDFVDTLHEPDAPTIVVYDNKSWVPDVQESGVIHINPTPVLFIRGDTNADDTINIADVACTLSYLFGGGNQPECMDSVDANDDGVIDIADPVALLGYLFGGTGPLPPPSPECGIDPTPDDLSCEAGSCEQQ